jgi:hypothetical protein
MSPIPYISHSYGSFLTYERRIKRHTEWSSSQFYCSKPTIIRRLKSNSILGLDAKRVYQPNLYTRIDLTLPLCEGGDDGVLDLE